MKKKMYMHENQQIFDANMNETFLKPLQFHQHPYQFESQREKEKLQNLTAQNM